MPLLRSICLLFVLALLPALAAARDFAWIDDLNIRAEADPAGFRAELAARFRLGDAEISAVIGNCERPADAYLVLRFGEMSRRSSKDILERYRADRGHGWGALAQSLGIKPGSREFKALKAGHDLPRTRQDSPGAVKRPDRKADAGAHPGAENGRGKAKDKH